MPNVTNSLIANIIATNDGDGTVPINRGTGNPSFDSTVASFVDYIALANGPNNIVLPATTCYQLYVKNNDPTNDITIILVPVTTGTSVTVIKLKPGDQIFIWQKPGGAGAGFTALTLTASAPAVLCEYFIGG